MIAHLARNLLIVHKCDFVGYEWRFQSGHSRDQNAKKKGVRYVLTDLVESLEDLVKARSAIFALRATFAVGAISSECMDVGGVSKSREGLVRNISVDSLVGCNSRNDLVVVDAMSRVRV